MSRWVVWIVLGMWAADGLIANAVKHGQTPGVLWWWATFIVFVALGWSTSWGRK